LGKVGVNFAILLNMGELKTVVILIGALLIVSLFFGIFVIAQESTTRGLAISPLTFELSANPGDSLENKIKVSNPSESTISIKMEVEDFTATGEMGYVVVEETENETYSLKKWVRTTPEEFTLKPGEQKFVTFIIDVPENAEPGGKYGSVLAAITGVVGPEGSGVAVAQKVGALVLLSVSGEIKEEIKVKEFFAPCFSEYGPIPFTLRFENTGTVHGRPRGLVSVTNIFGKQVANIEFPQKNVLPGAIRKVETSWNQNWLWGIKYQATLVGSYGASNIPLSAVVNFWVFPWKIGLGILLVLILVVCLIVRTRGRIKKAEEILKREEKRD